MDSRDEVKLILCVDDEAQGLILRKALLESQGYRVLTAERGQDAMVVFTSRSVDLVFSIMPCLV
jgi:CheY-like chemotaxis protein